MKVQQWCLQTKRKGLMLVILKTRFIIVTNFFLLSLSSHCMEKVTSIDTVKPESLDGIVTAGISTMQMAIDKEDLETLAHLIRDDAQLDVPHCSGLSALDYAHTKGRHKALRCLLRSFDSNGNALIHKAAKDGLVERIEYLHKLGSDVALPNKEGALPLFLAIENGHRAAMRTLVALGADVNAENGTALLIALASQKGEVVDCLLDLGISMDALMGGQSITVHGGGFSFPITLPGGVSVFHLAAAVGNKRIIDYFIQRKVNIEIADSLGQTPLIYAAANGQLEALEYLAAHGARFDIKNKTGANALFLAAEKKSNGIAVIQWLVKKGLLDAAKNENGLTPLHIAAVAGHCEAIELFVKSQIPIEAEHKEGQTALQMAAQFGQIEAVDLLIKLGGKGVDVRNSKGQTALYNAAMGGQVATIERLVSLGADINAQTVTGSTPLRTAVLAYKIQAIECLVRLGADINLKSGMAAMAPLHFAASVNQIAAIECLVRLGADLEIQAGNGLRPIEMAYKEGHQEAVDCLRRLGSPPPAQGWQCLIS